MKLPSLPDFLTPIRDVTASYEQKGKLSVEKKKQHTAVENLMADPAELKAEADRQIDDHAAAYRSRVHVAVPDPSHISFVPSGSPHTPLTVSPYDLLCFFCWSNRNGMKKNMHEQIDEMVRGTKTITKAERARQLQKLDEEIRQIELEREQMAVELEKIGLQITRDENLNPEIFLEFQSPTQWNRRKLEDLKSSIAAGQNQAHEVNQEIQAVVEQQHQWRPLIEHATRTDDKERFKGYLTDAESRKKDLIGRRDGLDNANLPRQKLFNACVEFLKTRGVEFERPTVVRLAS